MIESCPIGAPRGPLDELQDTIDYLTVEESATDHPIFQGTDPRLRRPRHRKWQTSPELRPGAKVLARWAADGDHYVVEDGTQRVICFYQASNTWNTGWSEGIEQRLLLNAVTYCGRKI